MLISNGPSSIAWARTDHLSLPMPLALPVLSTITTIAGPFVMVVVAKAGIDARGKAISFLAPYIRYLLTLLPFTILILSAIYGVRSNLFACSLDTHWSNLYSAKDESIRVIEQTLRCCGLNSIRDRPWPFPARDVDVTACERTLGYTVRCRDPWQRQEQIAAGLVFLASLLNWIVLVRVHRYMMPFKFD